MTTQAIERPAPQTPTPLVPTIPAVQESREMYLSEFLEKLSEAAPQYYWREANDCIRGYSNKIYANVAGLRLLGYLVPGTCPITAVAKLMTGKGYSSGNYNKAAERTHVPSWLARNIADAADIKRGHEALRKQLFGAVGI